MYSLTITARFPERYLTIKSDSNPDTHFLDVKLTFGFEHLEVVDKAPAETLFRSAENIWSVCDKDAVTSLYAYRRPAGTLSGNFHIEINVSQICLVPVILGTSGMEV